MLAWVIATALATDLAAVPWYEHYLEGVRLVEQGKGANARSALERAIKERPEAGLQLRTDGRRSIDYLPHLYLAVACHMAGDVEAARAHLQAAEDKGIEGQSPIGGSVLQTYRVLLARDVPAVAPAEATEADRIRRSRFAQYERKAAVLPPDEYQRLKTEALERCHLRPETEVRSAPWYFHYDLGQRLAERGDPQRALDAFIEAALRRPKSRHAARIYGMWFTDYTPYFHIARAHARLGNWECARDALAVSDREGELSAGDREMAELRQLLTEGTKKDRPQP